MCGRADITISALHPVAIQHFAQDVSLATSEIVKRSLRQLAHMGGIDA
jgi:hypothetical protein